MQKTSEAEFFIRLMDGSVWTVVDLDDRIKVKYVPWYSRVVLSLEVRK